MKITDFITDYRQIEEIVGGVYKETTSCKLSEDLSIKICSSTKFKLETFRLAIRYGDISLLIIKNFVNQMFIRSFTFSDTRSKIYLTYGGHTGGYNVLGRKILLLNNPLWVVLPIIFHEIGHDQYEIRTKKYTNVINGEIAGDQVAEIKNLHEIAALLYEDELVSCTSKSYSKFKDLEIISTSQEFGLAPKVNNLNQRLEDLLHKFRAKSFSNLNDKINFLCFCDSLEELEEKLNKIP